MKKYLLFSMCLIGTSSFAQNNISYSVNAGLNSATISGEASNNLSDLIEMTDGILQTQNRSGFYAGMNLEIPVSENFAIAPGLYYAQKGYSMKGSYNIKGLDFIGLNAKAVLQNDYIEMPVLAKAKLGAVEIFAGPQISYLAGSKLKTSAGALGFNVLNKSFDVSNQFNTWDASILGGIGFQISKNINLHAAYDYGLSKIDAGKNLEAYNRTLKLGVGINF